MSSSGGRDPRLAVPSDAASLRMVKTLVRPVISHTFVADALGEDLRQHRRSPRRQRNRVPGRHVLRHPAKPPYRGRIPHRCRHGHHLVHSLRLFDDHDGLVNHDGGPLHYHHDVETRQEALRYGPSTGAVEALRSLGPEASARIPEQPPPGVAACTPNSTSPSRGQIDQRAPLWS